MTNFVQTLNLKGRGFSICFALKFHASSLQLFFTFFGHVFLRLLLFPCSVPINIHLDRSSRYKIFVQFVWKRIVTVKIGVNGSQTQNLYRDVIKSSIKSWFLLLFFCLAVSWQLNWTYFSSYGRFIILLVCVNCYFS